MSSYALNLYWLLDRAGTQRCSIPVFSLPAPHISSKVWITQLLGWGNFISEHHSETNVFFLSAGIFGSS